MDPKSAMESKLKNTTWNNNNNSNKMGNNEKVIQSGVKWDYPYGYGCSWPPRHYTCSFCKREFKSAQALGGHMNVHRRDRAAKFIHHSPPSSSTSLSWLHAYEIPNPNPNPNPNPSGFTPLSSSSSSSSPSAARASIYTHQYSLVSLSLSCLSSALPGGENQSVDLGERFHGPSSSNFMGGFSFKDEEDQAAVNLDLELGLIRDTKFDDDHDLDLELRLGNQKP